MAGERVRIRLALASALALFLEMAAIRWFNATIHVVAYFANLVLVASFLGLGLGCLNARRRDLMPLMGPLLVAAVLLGEVTTRLGLEPPVPTGYVEWATQSAHEPSALPTVIAVLLVFVLDAALFLPLGQILGRLFDAVRAADPARGALRAYAYDIVGSVTGVVAFAIASALQAPPIVWFGIVGLGSAALVEGRRALTIHLASAAAVLVLVVPAAGSGTWSPYYRVRAHPVLVGSDARAETVAQIIDVDGVRIQDAISFSSALDMTPLAPWRGYYRLAYHLFAPKSVLILGAGAGNDAVAALDAGADRVVAVEIDPVIAGMGKTIHPGLPYKDSRVKVVVDDARAYLARTDERFDLCVMSALDSHRQIAGAATLRLESFVYTVECFRAVRRAIAPGGAFVLNLMSARPWMGPRVYESLAEAWEEKPRVFTSARSPFNSVAFVVGGPRDLADRGPAGDGVVALPFAPAPTELATDDWPHLYLERRSIPPAYLVTLGAMVAITALAVLLSLPRGRRRMSPHFMLLGCGFMLLETRSLTALALLLGSTWEVNAVVVGAILLVILAANQAVVRDRAPSRRTAYLLLGASLALAWAVPLDRLLDLGLALRIGLGGLYVAIPVAFAAVIFSRSLARSEDVARALGANLLGVVLGGALEYTSTLLGLRAIFLVALGVYALSALALRGEEVAA
jgi:hypothetical protein